MFRRLERLALSLLTRADAVANRWYGWRFNPLYQSGTIVVALYVTLVVTGIWLLLFYRVGGPWESVGRITADLWLGNWVRGLHRYATDAAVVFTAIHALRMFAQGRSWGARTIAWMSGAVLTLLLMLCAWTGYVMVWDAFGERLAREGARMADVLPVLSEPVSRAFTGERPVPGVFFFITLFAHIGIPLGMGLVFWLHVRRLQRPVLLPPRPLMWGVVGLLTAVAIAWPLAMSPKADPFTQAAQVSVDVFVAPWLLFTDGWSGGQVLALLGGGFLVLLLWPAVAARRRGDVPPPSVVDSDLCTGCTQCSVDCPYAAIDMRARDDDRPTMVGYVNADLCVSCGICAGSCPPMGVGPAGRTGRDQLVVMHDMVRRTNAPAIGIVVVGCEHGAGAFAADVRSAGAVFHEVGCTGNLHTSVIEHLIRDGASGVLVLACPPRDCWNREGPRWLSERVYHDREAELQARVPRTHVRIAYANAAERPLALDALQRFAADLSTLGPVPGRRSRWGVGQDEIGTADVVGVECAPKDTEEVPG